MFGLPDAKNAAEVEGLKTYFLEFPAFSSIVLGQKTIIVGRKGTGKTAVRCRLWQAREDSINIELANPPLPGHHIFRHYAEQLGANAGDPPVEAYEAGWRAYVVGTVLATLRNENLLSIIQTITARTFVQRMRVSSPDIFSRISEIAMGFSGFVSASVTLKDAPELSRYLPSEGELNEIVQLCEKVAQLSGKQIRVAIDRVDRQLDQPLGGASYEAYLRYVCGLCSATARFNAEASRHRFIVYAMVREDLFNQLALRFHNLTEFEGLVHRLRWNQEQLMDLLALRLSRATGAPYSPAAPYDLKRRRMFSKQMFYAVFEEGRSYDRLPLWSYMLSHTHMRPRDLIQFCDACREIANQSRKYVIDGNAINTGCFDYSVRRYQDLISESVYRISNFKAFIDSFRGRDLRWNLNDLRVHLGRVVRELNVADAARGTANLSDVDAMQYLYDIGFIVARLGPEEGRAARLPFISYNTDPYLPVSNHGEWAIHPAYHRELRRGQEVIPINEVLDASSAAVVEDDVVTEEPKDERKRRRRRRGGSRGKAGSG